MNNNMIDNYVNKLIENLPDDIIKQKQNIDLVLDGGAFNGSYMVGSLYFLKEMERRNYINVKRISGCSIGSVVGFLYFIDSLDMMPLLYEIINNEFKKNYTLSSLKILKDVLQHRIPDNICSKINGKLFISYNNIKKRKKTIKSHYKDIDHIIDTIIKSCYLPFFVDGNLLYKNKYVDGITPYMFNKCKNKKILHINLLGYDKFFNIINIKNEKSNFHRILSGLLDIHTFYVKGGDTSMCSYVNNWNITSKIFHNIKLVFEQIVLHFIYIIVYLKKIFPNDINDNIIYKILSRVSFNILSVIIETYFI